MHHEGESKACDISELKIEPMHISDLDEVLTIENASFSQPWTRDMFEDDLLYNERTHYIVARLRGRVVGYAGMWLFGDEAHITTIAVHPEFRRRGIGNTLMRSLLLEAMRRGAKWATLEVRASNKVAQQLYMKWGFKVVGIRRNYYSNPQEDALVLELPDIEEALSSESKGNSKCDMR
jgi:ribosomal-protein-alanine N-acetyltransferase